MNAVLSGSAHACDLKDCRALVGPLQAGVSSITTGELATWLGGRLIGSPDIVVRQVVHPRQANAASDLVMVLDMAVLDLLRQTPVEAIVIPEEGLPLSMDASDEDLFAMMQQATGMRAALIVKRPRVSMAHLLSLFNKPLHVPSVGVHPMAMVSESAVIGENVKIGAFCTVGDRAVIGADTVLMPNVTIGADAVMGDGCLIQSGVRIGERVKLGHRVIVHFNAAIGADGFSYVTPEVGSIESAREAGKVEAKNTQLMRINSLGTVILEDDVEVGAGTTIDRATLGETRIGRGTKLDNQVMIGHNNTVGENCLIVSQVGLAGSCKIGNRVVIAGQAGLADHLTVGDDAIITAKAGVMNDVAAKEVVAGLPALPRRQTMTNLIYINKLKDMAGDIKSLKKQLQQLEGALSKVASESQNEDA
jgi:UDP-3-O-[3-hydroxymyristoyl] glucosamine N-acyltransferase